MKEIGILTHVHSALTKKMEYFFCVRVLKILYLKKITLKYIIAFSEWIKTKMKAATESNLKIF